MKGQILFAGCFVLLMAANTSGQTKITGSLTCNKPEPVYSIEVGDRPGHTMVLEKVPCSYTKPMEINGDKAKDGASIVSIDLTSTRMVSTGTHVATMESGDQTFAAIRDTSTVKDGKPADTNGTWSYTGGTGKYRGLKGKGTYKASRNEDGTITVEVEGEYQLVAAKASTKK